VDQVVECLPSKCEALSSNPNAAKKLVWSTLYIAIELSQWNPLALLTYANKNSKKFKKTKLVLATDTSLGLILEAYNEPQYRL
jgi:hypothetical protein